MDTYVHLRAGESLLAELEGIYPRGTRPDTVVAIVPHKLLNCRRIFHAVGPVWKAKSDQALMDRQLARVYRSALELAVQENMSYIAFSIVSAGDLEFPKARAAEIAMGAVRDFLATKDGDKIVQILFLLLPTRGGPTFDEK